MESLYAKNNKYGYRLNVNHPYINKLYLRFKASKGIEINIPISDINRREFEVVVIELLQKQGLLPNRRSGESGN